MKPPGATLPSNAKIAFGRPIIQSIRAISRVLSPQFRRAVGSTLLLNGLEAEVAVILDADGLNARNLYVAMTRASKRLALCGQNPVSNPVW